MPSDLTQRLMAAKLTSSRIAITRSRCDRGPVTRLDRTTREEIFPHNRSLTRRFTVMRLSWAMKPQDLSL